MLDQVLDDHRRGAAALQLFAMARRRSSQPHICPAAGLALLRWRRAIEAGDPLVVTVETFCRVHYLGSNASYNARQLQALGLISAWRRPTGHDRRLVDMQFTPAGLAWCDEIAALLGRPAFLPVAARPEAMAA